MNSGGVRGRERGVDVIVIAIHCFHVQNDQRKIKTFYLFTYYLLLVKKGFD